VKQFNKLLTADTAFTLGFSALKVFLNSSLSQTRNDQNIFLGIRKRKCKDRYKQEHEESTGWSFRLVGVFLGLLLLCLWCTALVRLTRSLPLSNLSENSRKICSITTLFLSKLDEPSSMYNPTLINCLKINKCLTKPTL